MCFYVAKLANEGLAHSTIKSYLSAIRHLQIPNGHPDPHIGDMPRLSQVIKGIKSHQAKQGRQNQPCLPITPTILRDLKRIWDRAADNFDHIMVWAACTLCFFGFMRAGEITVPYDNAYDPTAHLFFADIAIDDPGHPTIMQVRIKASKADPFRKGIDVYIGRTYNDICPVAAMLAYLAIRGAKSGPLFHFQDKKPLTRERFVARVRTAISSAGLSQNKYAGHSFRIGAATTAAQCDIPDSTIKLLGRWESAAYLLYVRTPRQQLAEISTTLSRV